ATGVFHFAHPGADMESIPVDAIRRGIGRVGGRIFPKSITGFAPKTKTLEPHPELAETRRWRDAGVGHWFDRFSDDRKTWRVQPGLQRPLRRTEPTVALGNRRCTARRETHGDRFVLWLWRMRWDFFADALFRWYERAVVGGSRRVDHAPAP